MKPLATSGELSQRLRGATLWPLIFVGIAIAVTFSAVLLRQHRERTHELQSLFRRTVEGQTQFFAQELLLARSEAILMRLEHLAGEWERDYPGSSPCVEVRPFGGGAPLPKIAHCASDAPSLRGALRGETVITAGDSPLGWVSYWQQVPPSLTLSGLRALSAVFVVLFLLAILAHVFLVRRVERRVLWPLVERLVEERRKAEVVDVVRMVAHDIRRPFQLLVSAMRSIPVDQLGASKALMQRVLADVEQNADGVNSMLDDVLDTHRVVSLVKSEVLLQPYLESIVREGELSFSEQEEARIEVFGDPDTRCSLDAKKFRRALANLVENAVQAAGSSGRVTVNASTVSRKGGESLEIAIWNNGPPVAPDDMEKLFVQSFSRRQGGTGLGLISARRIVEAHGGTIRCQSDAASGTTFTVTLPVISDPARRAERAERVVAFDDDPSIRALFLHEGERSRHPAIHVFPDWETFVRQDAYELLDGATAVIDMNYRGSNFQGSDIARHAKRLGARYLVAFTSDPAFATACGAFDEVVDKSRFDFLRRFFS